MKIKTIIIATLALLVAMSGYSQSLKNKKIYDFTVKDIKGNDVSLADYKGKVLLIVNVASKCGFTPQYEGLEALYLKYKDQGLVILAFPCNQFLEQEPGTNEEIEEFCRINYGVTFPLMAKSDVNGEDANDIFKWLYSEKPFAGFGDSDRGKAMDGMLSRGNPEYASNPDIKWNFTKFLIDKKGRVVARFEPVVTPEDLESQIQALL